MVWEVGMVILNYSLAQLNCQQFIFIVWLLLAQEYQIKLCLCPES